MDFIFEPLPRSVDAGIPQPGGQSALYAVWHMTHDCRPQDADLCQPFLSNVWSLPVSLTYRLVQPCKDAYGTNLSQICPIICPIRTNLSQICPISVYVWVCKGVGQGELQTALWNNWPVVKATDLQQHTLSHSPPLMNLFVPRSSLISWSHLLLLLFFTFGPFKYKQLLLLAFELSCQIVFRKFGFAHVI